MTAKTHVASSFPARTNFGRAATRQRLDLVTAEDRPDVVVNIDPDDRHEASRQAAEETEVSSTAVRFDRVRTASASRCAGAARYGWSCGCRWTAGSRRRSVSADIRTSGACGGRTAQRFG